MQSITPDIFLEIILYLDEIEIVNPIGSHVIKHKVTMIYFTLANIPPEFRSKFEGIQLLGIVKTSDVKSFKLQKVLKDFTETVNKLSGDGINVKGSLIIVPADIPAAQLLA